MNFFSFIYFILGFLLGIWLVWKSVLTDIRVYKGMSPEQFKDWLKEIKASK